MKKMSNRAFEALVDTFYETGRQDAQNGIPNRWQQLAFKEQGIRPTFDPERNLRDQIHVNALNRESLIEDREEDLREVEDRRTELPTWWLNLIGFIVFLVVEMLAWGFLFKNEGVAAPQRHFFGLILTSFCFVLASQASAIVREGGMGKKLWGCACGIFLLMLSFAVMKTRIDQVSVETEGRSGLGSGLLFFALTLGPALIAEALMRNLVRSLRAKRKSRFYQRESNKLIKPRDNAQKHVYQVGEDVVLYDERNLRLQNAYEAGYQLGQRKSEHDRNPVMSLQQPMGLTAQVEQPGSSPETSGGRSDDNSFI